jgi:pyrroline-5-carboxylate reductase
VSVPTPTIGLLGAGNMAGAMITGWVGQDPAAAERILVTDRGSGRAQALGEHHGVHPVARNAELVERADLVVICVKPVDVERALREVSGLITPAKTIASVAAGVRTATLETILDVDAPVFRFMPNVGVRVCAGTLAYSAGRFTHTEAERQVLDAFSRLGEVVALDERLFDAATALSGSGPAFLGLIIEAFEDAGIVSGLTYDDARRLLLSTVSGTAELLRAEDLACSALRRMVTSPGGTAAAGLATMEREGVRGAIIDGVVAAMRRAGELG